MINLSIVMFNRKLFALCLLIMIWISPVSAQGIDAPELISPHAGEVLQGGITISGSVDIPGFSSYEVSYAYQGSESNWFIIKESREAVHENVLAVWDTSVITDGNYALRIRVNLQDGQFVDDVVGGLRVRNYTIIETSTPEPTLAVNISRNTPTITHTPRPTPTRLPVNPIKVTNEDVLRSITQGAGAAILLLTALGCYKLLKRFSK
jgi:hypothetical protein